MSLLLAVSHVNTVHSTSSRSTQRQCFLYLSQQLHTAVSLASEAHLALAARGTPGSRHFAAGNPLLNLAQIRHYLSYHCSETSRRLLRLFSLFLRTFDDSRAADVRVERNEMNWFDYKSSDEFNSSLFVRCLCPFVPFARFVTKAVPEG